MIPKTRFDHVDKLLRDEADGVAVEPADALLADAERDGDPVSILRAARMAGWAHRQAEDPPQALARFSRALAVGARLETGVQARFAEAWRFEGAICGGFLDGGVDAGVGLTLSRGL